LKTIDHAYIQNCGLQIEEAFKEWCASEMARDFGLGNSECYSKYPLRTRGLGTLNPYILTESDIQLHFGAYLQNYLRSDNAQIPYGRLIVHSEMPIYTSGGFADLTIHLATPGTLWAWTSDKSPLLETLVGVIEIKYANAMRSDDYIKHDKKQNVFKDIKKLSDNHFKMDHQPLRYMLILDEAGRITRNELLEIKEAADNSENKVIVLTNNAEYWALP
jgi:hypothetical protein